MSDMAPTSTPDAAASGDDKTSPEEKRVRSVLAKALFRSVQEIQQGDAPVSKENKSERREATAKVWKETRKVYMKQARKVVRDLNLTPEIMQLPPRKKKNEAGAGNDSAE